jgi:hypothetical protein
MGNPSTLWPACVGERVFLWNRPNRLKALGRLRRCPQGPPELRVEGVRGRGQLNAKPSKFGEGAPLLERPSRPKCLRQLRRHPGRAQRQFICATPLRPGRNVLRQIGRQMRAMA